ncbi:hypothetical protein [Streptomyces sp. NPDC047928]|uniref:hypothetical protein n=1 Tax=unclassified Streptomyces TaxID=2593676 RepID=UPI00371FCF80
MWEARALPGRGGDLLEWARAQPLAAEPLRRETFSAAQDRVLVLTWWEVPADAPYDTAALPELPDPATELVTRPVHRWRFRSHGVDRPLPR